MSTHTPGPWRKPLAKEDYAGACVVRDDGYIVADCNVFGGDGAPSAQECEANARLIRAAPDLLAACKSALERIDGMNEAMGVVDELRAAIAKATGAPARK